MNDYLTNSNGSPTVIQSGAYENFNVSGVPTPGRSYPAKKGNLRPFLADSTVSPYVEMGEVLEILQPYCFVEFTTDGLKSWFSFGITKDTAGNEVFNTSRFLVPGINDNKENAHSEYLQRINEFEGAKRNAAAAAKEKADQLAAENFRGAVASELKGLRLRATNDLKKALKGKTVKEILSSKEASSAAADYHKYDAYLKAI